MDKQRAEEFASAIRYMHEHNLMAVTIFPKLWPVLSSLNEPFTILVEKNDFGVTAPVMVGHDLRECVTTLLDKRANFCYSNDKEKTQEGEANG